MNGDKKYWIFWKKWTFIFLKNETKLQFKRMDGYWILFFWKLVLSNNVIKLNKDWNTL